MIDVDLQGTLKITMICGVEPRGHGQGDTQVDVFRCSKKKLGNLNTCRLVKLSCYVE